VLISSEILFIQLALALAVAVLVFRILKSIRRVIRVDLIESQVTALRRFPPVYRGLMALVFRLSPLISRFSRSSAAIQRRLNVLGLSPEIDDLLFSQISLGLILMICTLASGLTVVAVISGFELLIRPILVSAAIFVGLAFIIPRVWLSDQVEKLRRSVLRGFPSFLDVLALVLESGQNFQSALQLAIQHLGGTRETGLGQQLAVLAQDIRSGQTKSVALQRFADRLALSEITQFVASIRAADQQGVSVTALLRRQAEQLRTSRALEAERQAMKLPVKLLMPLAICIFPCTFMVLAVPLVSRLAGSGLF
jgi:tight adherence protein C